MATKTASKKSLKAAVLLACVAYLAASGGAISNAGVMSFTVANSIPSVGQIECSREGQYVSCNATLTDLNGFQDLTGCNGTLHKEDWEYRNASCIIYGGLGVEATCACIFQVKDGETGVWTASITAQDNDTQGLGENKVNIGFYDTRPVWNPTLGGIRRPATLFGLCWP
jgi:hypothetical protein